MYLGTSIAEACQHRSQNLLCLNNLLCISLHAILGLQPRDKAAMLGANKIAFFSRRIYMEIQFSSQRSEKLLFLTTNMAAVTSHANQRSIKADMAFQVALQQLMS